MASMEMIDKDQILLQVKSESRVKEIPCHLNFLSSYVEKKKMKILILLVFLLVVKFYIELPRGYFFDFTPKIKSLDLVY